MMQKWMAFLMLFAPAVEFAQTYRCTRPSRKPESFDILDICSRHEHSYLMHVPVTMPLS
jgi:hypothetical protein